MHLPYAIPDGEHDGTGKEALVIVNDEPFSQECLVQAIHNTFPHTLVIGISAVHELQKMAGAAITLVLLRVQADQAGGSQLAAEIRVVVQQCPNTPIVILAPCMNAALAGEVIALGVRGIIPVTTPFKIAVAAIQLVMAGGTYYPYPFAAEFPASDAAWKAGRLSPEAPESFLLSHRTTSHSFPIVGRNDDLLRLDGNGAGVIFTTRELEVLEGLQKGWSNKWIAHSLHLSENTVKVHIQRIMRKLHATNRTEAVVRHRQLQAAKPLSSN